MAVNIGPRIGVEGEEAYRAQMSQIIQQAKTLDSEMKAVTSSFTKNTKEQEKDAATTKVLTAQIENQQKRVQMLTEMVEKSTAATGEDSNATLKWKQALNEAQAELNRLSNAADDAGKKTSIFGDMLKANLASDAIVSGIKAIGSAIADVAKGVVEFGTTAVQSFADLEQNIGGSEAVFGEYADSLQQYAEDAYRTMATSESEYLATANKMGALFQGSGLSAERSMELTVDAMQRAADMASVMGIDTAAALEAVTGAAKGNYTMMDNLGVAMNATTLEAYAVSKGMNTAFSSMSNAEKAELAMQYFFENTTQYAGNFEREARTTISGSIGMLTASVESWVAGLGNTEADIAALSSNVIDAFMAVVQNVVPIVQNIISALPAVIAEAIPAIQTAAPQLIQTVGDVFAATLSMLIDLAPEMIPIAIDLVMEFCTGLLAPDSITQLVDAAIQIVLALANGLIAALPQLIEAIPVIVSSLVIALMSNLPELLRTGVNLIGAVAEGLLAGLSGIISSVARIGDSIVQGFYDLIQNAATWGQDLIQNFINGIASRVGALWDTVKNVAQGIRDFIGFSEPDKGPLSNFHTFAPDMMALFMQGIKDNQAQLQTTFSTAFDFRPLLDAPAAGTNTTNTHNYGGVTVQVYGAPGQDMSTLADEIMYRIQDATARKEAVFR